MRGDRRGRSGKRTGALVVPPWSLHQRNVWRVLLLLAHMIVGLAIASPRPSHGAPGEGLGKNQSASVGSVGSASNEHATSASEGEKQGLWYAVTEDTLPGPVATRRIADGRYRTLGLDHDALVELLERAPLERTTKAAEVEVVIELPWPDGGFKRFRVEESPIMEAELAAQLPEIKTYAGQGIEGRLGRYKRRSTSGRHSATPEAARPGARPLPATTGPGSAAVSSPAPRIRASAKTRSCRSWAALRSVSRCA